MQMTILYAWNTLNAAFYDRLKGRPRDVGNLMVQCELLLESKGLRTPFDSASGH